MRFQILLSLTLAALSLAAPIQPSSNQVEVVSRQVSTFDSQALTIRDFQVSSVPWNVL